MKGATCLVIGWFLVTNISASYSTIQLFREFRSAVTTSYNPNDNLTENLIDILSLLCPETLFCEEDIPGALKDAKDMLYNGTDLVSQSRILLINKFGNYTKCCPRCKCTPDCVSKANCCPKSILNHGQNNSKIFECVSSDMTVRLQSTPYAGPAFYMITKCNPVHAVFDTKKKCEQPDVHFPDETIPVHSENLGKIYFNKYCAVCNFANDTEQWQIRFTFKRRHPLRSIPTEPHALYRDLLGHTVSGRANMIFTPRHPDRIRSLMEPCVPFINPRDTCPKKEDSSIENYNGKIFLKEACGHAAYLYQTNWVFNNIFCMLCSVSFAPVCRNELNRYTSGYITALFGFSSNSGTPNNNPPVTTNEPCSCTEWYDSIKGICRTVICPVWETRVYCECKRLISMMSGIDLDLRVTLRILTGDESAIDDITLKTRLLKQIISTLQRFLGTFHFSVMSNEQVYLCRSEAGDFLYVLLTIINDFEYDMRQQAVLLYKTLVNNPVLTTGKRKFKVSIGPFYGKESTRFTRNFQMNGNETNCTLVAGDGKLMGVAYRIFTKSLYCERVEIIPADLNLLVNVSAEFRSVDDDFLPYVYDQTLSVMCLEDLVRFVQQISSANLFKSVDTFRLTVSLLLVNPIIAKLNCLF